MSAFFFFLNLISRYINVFKVAINIEFRGKFNWYERTTGIEVCINTKCMKKNQPITLLNLIYFGVIHKEIKVGGIFSLTAIAAYQDLLEFLRLNMIFWRNHTIIQNVHFNYRFGIVCDLHTSLHWSNRPGQFEDTCINGVIRSRKSEIGWLIFGT